MANDDEELQARLEALFVDELQENLAILTEGFDALEAAPGMGMDTEAIHRLFRAAHSLKGAAHSVGVTEAIEPCRRLEELLADVRDHERPLDRDLTTEVSAHLRALQRLESRLVEPVAEPDGGDSGFADSAAGPAGTPVRARVPVARLRDVIERTAALVTSSQQLRSLAEDVAAAAGSLTADGHRLGPAAGGPDADLAASVSAMLTELADRASEKHRELKQIASHVSEAALQLRLQPFGDVTAGLERAVRDLAQRTGRSVRLVVEGADAELDRDIGDAIREPLLHLVRNAVDHGVGAPDDRRAAGKVEQGTVRVEASTDGPNLVVKVSDDGFGIDVDAIRARAATDEDRDVDVLELAFRPGVSTADAVTDVSGRGVGLDAVRAKVESLGGAVALRTEAGSGTEVELRVPRTLATVRVVVLDMGGDELVGIPVTAVQRIHRCSAEQVSVLGGHMDVVLDDARQPAASLAHALHGRAGSAPTDGHVAVEIVGEDTVLIATRAVTELEVVLQALPRRVGTSTAILGAATLDDGRLVLVVNPSVLLRAPAAAAAPEDVAAVEPAAQRTVLLAEDTVTTRALERSILEAAGYRVVVAADGAEALALLREHDVDIVVTDVDMPRMSGIDVCRAIRSSRQLVDLPVILVTSLGTDEDRRRGLEAGANAYLVKSAFDQHGLLRAVERFL